MPRSESTPARPFHAFRVSAPIAPDAWRDVEAAEGKPALRKFAIMAYTGAAMNLLGWRHPTVIDLAGLTVAAKSRPVLMDHDPRLIVGHSTDIVVGQSDVRLEGVVSGTGESAREIVESSRNGFPWQASIGASARRWEEVKAGDQVTVNGREFAGPLYVIRAADLKEVSFVALGADDNTEAAVAARNSTENVMTFIEWLNARGFAPETITDQQRSTLQAAYDAEHAAADGDAPSSPPASPSPVEAMRIQAAAEAERIAAVTAASEGHPQIRAQAIRDGWSGERTELAVLRASRPRATAPFAGSGAAAPSLETIEAGFALSVGRHCGAREDDIVARIGERNAQAARDQRLHRLGMRDLAAICARHDGLDIPAYWGDGEATIRAAFSSSSLPIVLGNTLNRELLRIYEGISPVALQVARVGTVSDFKQAKRTRLITNGRWSRVARGGELDHAQLSDQDYTVQADTSGEVVIIDRKSFIDDDLGAFRQLPQHWALAAAGSIDHEFFTLLLANPGTFFGVGNGNYIEGAGTSLGVDSLSQLVAGLQKATIAPKIGNADGKARFLNIPMRKLLVPPELSAAAKVLISSMQVVGAASKTPIDNPHRGMFDVASAPHLSHSSYTGNSATHWYLFADPNTYPAAEVAFLNGRSTPTVEAVQPPAGILGFSWHGYIDFGVAMLDPRAAGRSKGAA
jgi:hypothetical protein